MGKDIDFKQIRTYNHSQNAAFEELVCQLARHEGNDNYKRFVRNGTPDGGVECFWVLENGEEHAWQAKYVFDIDHLIAQIDKSFKTALETHPKMRRFVTAIPFNLPDPCYKTKKNNASVKSARKKWEHKVKAWNVEAGNYGQNIELELWTESDLLLKIMKPENEGMRYYWFHEKEFTFEWFKKKLKIALTDSGCTYNSYRTIPTKLKRKLECLWHTKSVNSCTQEEAETRAKQGILLYGKNDSSSYLLPDICTDLMEKGVPALLILGKQFIDTANPREQIKKLLQCNLNYDSILCVLNTIGESMQERILIAIDALEEGEGRRIWPEFLGGMLEELKHFPWVVLLARIKGDDIEDLLPAGYEKNMVKVPCSEFEDVHSSGWGDDVSLKEKEPVPGLFMIDREVFTTYQTGADSPIVQAYRRISTNIKYILYAVCSNATIECMLEDEARTLVDAVKNEVDKGSQAVFLLGYGGIGKSTVLVQTAVRLYKSGKRIFLFQLGKSNDQQIIDEVLKQIDQGQKQNYILFMDNPYDNSEGVKELLNKIQYRTNVQVVITERLNRFDSIAEDILPDLYFGSARIIVPVFNKEKSRITLVDGNQILRLKISREWKQEVVLHMFRNIPNVDMSEIKSIVSGNNWMSIIEWYLRTCFIYNKRVDMQNALATRCKVKLDWDEWKELFRMPHPQITDDEAKELQELFGVVAALDIFKIKASIKLLAQKSKIDEMRLDSILRNTLNAASSEPAIYENNGEYTYIALKHDMISNLYFEMTNISPQIILEHVVNILGKDKEMVIRFEKQVFKRKYIQHGKETPYNIDTKKLYRLFAQNPSYYEILKEKNRTYSFDVAGIWQEDERGNEMAVSDMWAHVLKDYESAESQMRLKIYMCCLDDCHRRNIPIPDILQTENNIITNLQMAIKKNDLQEIAAAWGEKLAQLYRSKMTGKVLVLEWQKSVFDYLLYAFEMPEEFFAILTYADYQVVDAAYASLENYVKRNRLDRCRYYRLGILLYKAIAKSQRTDISSRMRLAQCYIQEENFEQAERTYYEILEIYPEHMESNAALGNLYSRWLKERWEELKDNEPEEHRLLTSCEFRLKHAIDLAENNEDKGACYGAMGWFLYRTMKKYRESYDAFQTALRYYDQASTHSQLGMLCAYANKNNECFSISEAKFHFEKAIASLKSNDLGLLSAYMPYAKLNYCLGEYDEAVTLYEKSEQLGEQKANEALKKIRLEREELARLMAYPRRIITTLEMAYDLTCKDSSVFEDEQKNDEIFSLLLNTMADTKKTCQDIKLAVNIMLNFQRSKSNRKYGIIGQRMIQQVELAAIECGFCKTKAEQNFRSQCFFIGKNL